MQSSIHEYDDNLDSDSGFRNRIRRLRFFTAKHDLLTNSCMWALILAKSVAWPIFITFLFYTMRSPRHGIEQLYLAVSGDQPERISYDNFHTLLKLKLSAINEYHTLMSAISLLSGLQIIASSVTLFVGCGKDYRVFLPCFIVTTITALGLTVCLIWESVVVLDESLTEDMNELMQRATRWNANTFLIIEEMFPCSSIRGHFSKSHSRKTTIESTTVALQDARQHPNCDFLTERNTIQPGVVVAATISVLVFDIVFVRAMCRCYSTIGRKMSEDKPDWAIQFQSVRKRAEKHFRRNKKQEDEVENTRKLAQGDGLLATSHYHSQNWAIM